MTYCVAMCVDEGLVFLSDTRTNAGVDHISTARKMTVFELPGERVLVLLGAGNLSLTQAVLQELSEPTDPERPTLWSAPTMADAARVVGQAVRDEENLSRTEKFPDSSRFHCCSSYLSRSCFTRAVRS